MTIFRYVDPLSGERWQVVAGDVGAEPEILLELGAEYTRAQAGLSGIGDFFKSVFNWIKGAGKKIVSIIKKVGGYAQQVASWVSRQSRKVCVEDCGTLYVIDGVDGQGYGMHAGTSAECAGRLIVPGRDVPGWESPCSSVPYTGGGGYPQVPTAGGGALPSLAALEPYWPYIIGGLALVLVAGGGRDGQ